MTETAASGSGPINLLVGACGAGAAMVLPDYLMSFQAIARHRVRVVMTHSATRILPAATVRLVAEAVYCDGEDSFSPGHVGIAGWADQIIVLPATAHTLGQAAHGLAGSLLCSVLLAHQRPVLFFPSMNIRMWRQPSVQRNVEQLRKDGHHVIDPVMKSCWEIATSTFQVGPALPTPATVVRMVEEAFRAARPSGDPATDRRG